eukprot:gene10393-12292_t
MAQVDDSPYPGEVKSLPLSTNISGEANTDRSLYSASPTSHEHKTIFSGVIKKAKAHAQEEAERTWYHLPVKYATYIAESRYFEALVISLIVANCVSLSAYDPTISDQATWNRNLATVENAFNMFFTVEIIIRILSAGSLFAHFRSSWNIFDAVIVLVGHTAWFKFSGSSGVSGLRALRALRALRPLRTVVRVPALRQIASSFAEALPLLLSVVGVLLFYMVVFAIFGLALFMDPLHHRCIDEARIPVEPASFGCGNQGRQCPSGLRCAFHDVEFAEGYKAIPEEVAGFDNFMLSLLTVFITTTLEGWHDLMYRCSDSTSKFAIVYFVFLVLLGPFFVVLKIKFAESLAVDVEEPEHKVEDTSPAENSLRDTGGGELVVAILPANPSSYQLAPVEAWSPVGSEAPPADAKWWTCNFIGVCSWAAHLQEFSNFFLICILLNTAFLALEHHNMSESFEYTLDTANLVLTILFSIELSIKLIGLGLHEFFADNFNVFDLLIVLLSIIELALTSGVSLAAFRSFRVLRVFKVFTYSPSLARIIHVLLISFASFLSIAFLLFLFLAVFAIIGLHVFGNITCDDEFNCEKDLDENMRGSFQDIYQSFMLAFQILTLEGWNELMLKVVQKTNWYSALYFVAWVVIGNYFLLTLFLAVVMEAFEGKYERKDFSVETKRSLRKTLSGVGINERASRLIRRMSSWGTLESESDKSSMETSSSPLTVCVSVNASMETSGTPMTVCVSPNSDASRGHETSSTSYASTMDPIPVFESTKPEGDGNQNDAMQRWKRVRELTQQKDQLEDVANMVLFAEPTVLLGKSLGIFTPENEIRKALHQICLSQQFEFLMSCCILISCIQMAVEVSGVDASSHNGKALFALDLIVTSIFGLEVVMKVITYGFVMVEKAYIRSRWNQLDFLIVITSLLSYGLSSSNKNVLSLLRSLRVVRPLRIISRSPEIQAVVQALMLSVVSMLHVISVLMLFFLIFGILGVQLFKGRFYKCLLSSDYASFDKFADMSEEGMEVLSKEIIGMDQAACEECAYCKWQNSYLNFDNTGQAMLTLFVVGNLDGWIIVFHDAVDATPPSQAPERDSNPVAVVYLLAYICVVAFSLLNLFVGVVHFEFNRIKMSQKQGTDLKVTDSQKQWNLILYTITNMESPTVISPPSKVGALGYVRFTCFRIIHYPGFDSFIMICIILNTALMTMNYYEQTDGYVASLEVVNLCFTMIFALEFILKIFGLGPALFWANSWNRFDFILVMM